MNRASGSLRYGLLCLITLAVIGILTLVAEGILRRTQRFANWVEKNGSVYDPEMTTEQVRKPWLWLYSENTRFTITKTEFAQSRTTNSEGLSGALPPLEKKKDEYRIIAVGDSFTEGVGDAEGMGYVGRLASILSSRKSPRDYRVMNAGVAGSDPVFGLELIRRRLLKYRPDLVLLAMNATDVGDLSRRGGLDRFDPDGSLKRRAPAWAWLFARSHLFRAVVLNWLGYSWELHTPEESAHAARIAIRDLVLSCTEASRIASENGFKLLVIVQPHWFEIKAGKLHPALLEVEDGLRRNGVDFADLLPSFLSRIPQPIGPEYYWPIDSHFTPKGYEVFARAVEAELKKRRYVRD